MSEHELDQKNGGVNLTPPLVIHVLANTLVKEGLNPFCTQHDLIVGDIVRCAQYGSIHKVQFNTLPLFKLLYSSMKLQNKVYVVICFSAIYIVQIKFCRVANVKAFLIKKI